jgi:hypothetical protein
VNVSHPPSRFLEIRAKSAIPAEGAAAENASDASTLGDGIVGRVSQTCQSRPSSPTNPRRAIAASGYT